jgi:hypothetical protein
VREREGEREREGLEINCVVRRARYAGSPPPCSVGSHLDAWFPRADPDAPVARGAAHVGVHCGAHEHHATGLRVEDLGGLEHDGDDLAVIPTNLPPGLCDLGGLELYEPSVEWVYLLGKREAFICWVKFGLGVGGGRRGRAGGSGLERPRARQFWLLGGDKKGEIAKRS